MSKQLLLSSDEAITVHWMPTFSVYAYPSTLQLRLRNIFKWAPITTEQNIHSR